MLIDEVNIIVKAGKGGDGHVSFRREKYIPKGGPWGGNGGRGGNVYIEGKPDIFILNNYKNRKIFQAENGQNGAKAKKIGKSGKDLYLYVPTGTVVHDLTEKKVHELTKTDDRVLIAEGGVGGLGNWEYATATNQTPHFAQKGGNGQIKELFLELKLIAHAGLIGLPNAGKTSILNELSGSFAKVGNYNFTTLSPNLGAVGKTVLADIPGLIEGASKGKGLGFKFLKHIARTKIILHCISVESENVKKDYTSVRNELGRYDKKLLSKKEIILLTKTDLVDNLSLKRKINKLKITGLKVIPVSIHDWDQLVKLKKFITKLY